MILRLFERARIVPDNPFAFPPSMEVRLQISGIITRSFVQGCTYTEIAWMRRSSKLAIEAKQDIKKLLDAKEQWTTTIKGDSFICNGLNVSKYLLKEF